MLSMVPFLLPAIVSSGDWSERGACIRTLRLVNKELSSLAVASVTECAFDLCVAEYPEGMVELMSHGILEQLEINFLTAKGELGCTCTA